MSDRPETALLSKTAVVVDDSGGGGGGCPLVTAAGWQVAVVVATVRQYKNRSERKPPGKGRRASWSRLLPVARSLPKPNGLTNVVVVVAAVAGVLW